MAPRYSILRIVAGDNISRRAAEDIQDVVLGSRRFPRCRHTSAYRGIAADGGFAAAILPRLVIVDLRAPALLLVMDCRFRVIDDTSQCRHSISRWISIGDGSWRSPRYSRRVSVAGDIDGRIAAADIQDAAPIISVGCRRFLAPANFAVNGSPPLPPRRRHR